MYQTHNKYGFYIPNGRDKSVSWAPQERKKAEEEEGREERRGEWGKKAGNKEVFKAIT